MIEESSLFKLFLNKIGIDGAIAFTLIARIIQALSGVINIFFISLFLTKEEQGYYYTFGSLAAIQIFFELGLNNIITQYAAHEFAIINLKSKNEQDCKIHESRLSSLMHFCIKYFSFFSFILFISLLVFGKLFFQHFSTNSQPINWFYPWVTLSIGTSMLLFLNPLLALFEGIGMVKTVAKFKVIQQFSIIIISTLILYFNGGLWTLGLTSIVSSVSIFIFLIISKYRAKLLEIYNNLKEYRIDYWKEIFPFQYKIAISWISGYFIFQLFNPVLFANDGPIIAGQMGMSIAVLNGISSLSMSWIVTKIPLFSELIAKKEFVQLDFFFNKTVKQMMSIISLTVLFFILFIYILKYNNFFIVNKLLPINYLILLSIITIINQLTFSWATYLRCHKKEPFLLNSIVGGILMSLSTIILGNIFGIKGVVYGYTFLTIFIGLPWAYFIFKKLRLKWH
jgi:O-antigen/teichoic acid export membrane protein